MNFDSYITSGTKTALTVKNYTKILNKPELDKEKFSLKKAAFTLAETLITLTIIGVIAALTIPNLFSSYQKHTYVVGLKKAYSQLQNAVKMIPITQGCPAGDFDCVGWNYGYYDSNGDWVFTPVTNIEGQEFNGEFNNKQAYLLSKQFKINKLCYSGSTDETCKKIRDNYPNSPGPIGPTFMINDLIIYYDYASIGIDINGFKGPNKFGRDKFIFEFRENNNGIQVVPWGSKLYADVISQDYYWRNNNYCTTENANKGNSYAAYCAGRVLEEDAMNY